MKRSVSMGEPRSGKRRFAAASMGRAFGASFGVRFHAVATVLAVGAFCALTAPECSAGGIDDPTGQMRFEASFRYTPTSQDVAAVKDSLTRMSEMLCDATEGGVKVREIRLTTSGADEEAAGFWFHGGPGRSGGSYQSDGSSLERTGSHIDVFSGQRYRPGALVHLMGHHAFGLGDQYDEQQRRGSACGIGPGFERPSINERNHSIMQGVGKLRCAGGSRNSRACEGDKDCRGGVCVTVLASELSVPANHDSVRANGGVCPRPEPLSRITLKGLLPRDGEPLTDFDGTDFLSAAATSSYLAEIEAVDSLGAAPPEILYLYLTHKSELVWVLTAAIDAAAIGGPSGELRQLKQWSLGFNEDGSLGTVSEGRVALEISNLASGARNLHVAIDVGTPNPEGAENPGVGYDGLQMTASGGVRIDHQFDGSVGCSAPSCGDAWNVSTRRWETSEQTLLHGGASDWEALARNRPFLKVPSDLPLAAPPEDCLEAPAFVVDVAGSDQFLFVVDASASMGSSSDRNVGEVCGNARDDDQDGKTDEAECAVSKLAKLKSAIRAYLDLVEGLPVELGLVVLRDRVVVEAPIAPLDTEHRKSIEKILVELEPEGDTALGDALAAAYDELDRVSSLARSRTVLLALDGFGNAGFGAFEAGRAADGGRVRWLTVPLGVASDEKTLARLAFESSGVVVPAREVSDLPAVYAQLAARWLGDSLLMPRTTVSLVRAGSTKRRDRAKKDRGELSFEVEPGARELLVFLGARNPDPASWSVLFDFLDPRGRRYASGDAEVREREGYVVLRVPDPRPGTWTLRLRPGGPEEQEAIAVAFARNERVDLFADALPRFVEGSSPVGITARAVYVGDVEGDVSVKGTVLRPDGSEVPIELERHPLTRGWRIEFDDYAGRGLYEVRLEARATDGAREMQGEAIFKGPAHPQVRVEPTVRWGTTSFYAADLAERACTGRDCDGDGIDNRTENRCGEDADGDGIANRWDDDSDNDELSDLFEGTGDADDDGLPDFCDPVGAPSSLEPIMAAERSAMELGCGKAPKKSGRLVHESLTQLSRLVQTLAMQADPSDPRTAPVLETLRKAMTLKKRALIVAGVLPEFCQKFQGALDDALDLENQVADDVVALLARPE